ncbi:hypothetical protein [Luteimicrobium subarcticum]|uniref:Uncharacterized protein n=1 Tax=Luteimicrobium subarcticum TaxID=620910 RepID=A0A2M8W1D8_9MICO|nr:hypothetical protein [Luteimicrobium subarcticum]PJI84726.1 hypothetical protein CLV34_3181 [Luteimicrobium subarcticum]
MAPRPAARLTWFLRDLEIVGPGLRGLTASALVAAEIAFVSDVHGSGTDWQTTTGYDDAGTLGRLRSIQRRLGPVVVRP